MDALFEIRVEFDRCNSGGVAAALASQLRKAIADNRLPAGAKLPATRSAQAVFGISRNTLADVYERLIAEGYLLSRHGSGIYVADTNQRGKPGTPRNKPKYGPEFELNPFWMQSEARGEAGFWMGPADGLNEPVEIDFRPGLVDPRLFPFSIYRRVSAKQLRELEIRPPRTKNAQNNRGSPPLRMAIAAHVAVTRAVACEPDHVIVTSGAQQAFDLLARMLVVPGRTIVAVEDPGYPPMRVPFRAAGATIVPVGVDDEGLKVAEIPEGTKIICVCPSHQFPLGTAMSPRRRAALLAFARAHAAVIIEDDYDGELRFDCAPVDPLWNADTAEHVFYVGTFSKCMLPTFRLGFVIVPDWALDTITLIKNSVDGHCSIPVQRGIAGFIDEGHLLHHVRKMRTIYRKRRDFMTELIERHFAEWLLPLKCGYGTHLVALSKTSASMRAVSQMVSREGVAIHALDRYFLGKPTHRGLVFSFGITNETDIESGLFIIRSALEHQFVTPMPRSLAVPVQEAVK